MLPSAIKKFVYSFARLPQIGPRLATRLGVYLSEEVKRVEIINELITSLEEIKNIKECKNCFFLHETKNEICEICFDTRRNPLIIALVEKTTDLITLEKTGAFKGLYLVLGNLKKNGILDPEQTKRLDKLKERIQLLNNHMADEIILAISPTAHGDLNSDMLDRIVRPISLKISRLGRGIPTGGEIEFADELTLKNAIERRI